MYKYRIMVNRNGEYCVERGIEDTVGMLWWKKTVIYWRNAHHWTTPYFKSKEEACKDLERIKQQDEIFRGSCMWTEAGPCS